MFVQRWAAFVFILISSTNIIAGRAEYHNDIKMRKSSKEEEVNSYSDSVNLHRIHLPLILQPDHFSFISPIWDHSGKPGSYEVVFFRRTFTIEQLLSGVRLKIFSDTRYMVWMDGKLIGRGPARFSELLREYDVYKFQTLDKGDHVIAVLVQWDPNIRRSESVRPMLMASLTGRYPNGKSLEIRTDTKWKVMSFGAWEQNSSLVHSWGLIGSTELMNYQKLPKNWYQLNYSDDKWNSAKIVDPSINYAVNQLKQKVDVETRTLDQIKEYLLISHVGNSLSTDEVIYQPRSIPLLKYESITPTVVDAGYISPEYLIGNLSPSVTYPYTLPFFVQEKTEVSFESLAHSKIPPTSTITLSDQKLDWNALNQLDRPDILTSSIELSPGDYALVISNPSTLDIPFAISNHRILLKKEMPFNQGQHVGRRLLLANYVSNGDAVSVEDGQGLDIYFSNRSSYIVLDLGRVRYGRLTSKVSGSPDAIIDMGWDERLLVGRRPLPYPGSLHPEWNQTDSWILNGDTRTLTTIDARSGRYVLIVNWGGENVQLENVQIMEEKYPLEQTGGFESSDAELNEIWQVGADTTALNMRDAYADPWRERGQWWGDAFVVNQVNKVTFRDSDLLRRGLIFMNNGFSSGRPSALAPNGFSAHQLDYAMLWVEDIHEYMHLTQDHQFIWDIYPNLSDFIEYLENYEYQDTELLDIPMGHWSKTVYIDTYGYTDRFGQSTAINSMYYATLIKAADIASEIGHKKKADYWKQKAKLLKQQILSLLFNEEGHFFYRTVYNGEFYSPSIYSMAWPLAYELVPMEDKEQVASMLVEMLSEQPNPPNIGTYAMFWIFSGLAKSDHVSDAITLIKQYYGRELDLDATTWWERFDAIDYYDQALSHGWGSSPTWFLTTYLLGIQRVDVDSWLIKPSFTDVKYASGTLPFDQDVLEFHWEARSCQVKSMSLIAPDNTHGDVVLPIFEGMKSISLNGDVVWKDGVALSGNVTQELARVNISLTDGSHSIIVDLNCQ